MFGNLFKNQNGVDQGVYLGAPEAEAEALDASRVPLLDVYEDYHGIAAALSAEKFIITARKGCGKSAFAEYVTVGARSEPNLFAKFIRKNDFALEEIVQRAKDKELNFGAAELLKWIVLVHVISLFLESEAAQQSPKMTLLKEFLKKNSGYIEITKSDVIERIHKDGFSINVEPLRRFLRSTGKKEIETKSERAPFFRLLPHLQEVVRDVLLSPLNRSNDNKYILFFDDLDVQYDSGIKESKDFIVELLRTVKQLNGEVFDGLGCKVVILLRDDIEADLMSYGDTAKIFASYSHRIIWYQDGYARNIPEDSLNLKRFINKRIEYSLSKKRLEINRNNIWSNLVSYENQNASTFKDIVNMTLFRPRDLLLFFQPLENGLYYLPLSKAEVDKLARVYSNELSREMENELSFMFTQTEIGKIKLLLKGLMASKYGYAEARNMVNECGLDRDPDSLLEYLYSRSLVGNISNNGYVTFKCRQSPEINQKAAIDTNQKILVQKGLVPHLKNFEGMRR